MKRRVLLLGLALVLVLSLGLTACSNDDKGQEADVNSDELVKVKIGVSPVPHGEIVEALEDEFEAKGIDIEIVEFNDYVQPNLALAEGDLDLNYFQHEPYFDEFKESHNLDLTALGFVHIEPMAIFSSEYESLDEIPEGAEVSIPNDPSNGGRALLLLQQEGLIELADPEDVYATEEDIVSNPKNLVFKPLEAVSVAQTYEDVDVAVINTNYALDVDLDPKEDSLAIENPDSPYANLVAVRTEDVDNEVYQKVLEVLHSNACKEFIEEKYNGAVFPAFK